MIGRPTAATAADLVGRDPVLRARRLLFAVLWAWCLFGAVLRARGREPFLGLLAPGFDGSGVPAGETVDFATVHFHVPGPRRPDGTVEPGDEIPILRLLEGVPFPHIGPVLDRIGLQRSLDLDGGDPSTGREPGAAWLVAQAVRMDPRAAGGVVFCRDYTTWSAPPAAVPRPVRAKIGCRLWTASGPTGPADRRRVVFTPAGDAVPGEAG